MRLWLMPFLILQVLLTLETTHSQSDDMFLVSGRVLDSASRVALPGASVALAELHRGVSTGIDGRFHFERIPPGHYTVVTRFVGYATDSTMVTVAGNMQLTILLKSTEVRLSEVRVTVEVDEEYLKSSSRSVTVMTAKELDKHRGQTLGETIDQIPGVTLLSTGPAIAKPVVRGLHSQRVLVLNAGVPQEGQQWGGEHAPEIDPFAPARIEVLKGAAGVEYGAGAIGGVIRVDPRRFRESPGIDGELLLNGFSNNRQGSGALLLEGAHHLFQGFAWRVQGSARKAGDTKASSYYMKNTGFEELNASGALGFTAGNLTSQLYYSHFNTTIGVFSGAHIGNTTDLLNAIARGAPVTQEPFSYAIGRPKQQITHDLISLHVAQRLPNAGVLEFQGGYQQNNRLEFDAHKAFNEPDDIPSFDLLLTTWTADLKFKHAPVNELFGTIGVNGMRQGNVRKGNVFLIPNFRAYSAGAYAIESWVRGAVMLTAGVRYDYRWMEVYPFNFRGLQQRIHQYSSLSGALSGLYQFSDTWSFGANIGTAWRPPSINELYSNDVHHGTATFEIGDLNLQPERSISMDVTLKHASDATRAEISIYNNLINRYIFLYPDRHPTLTVRGAFPTYRYAQANAALRGLEAMIEWRVSDLFKFNVTGSLLRGTSRDTGQPLIGMPADRLRVLTHFDLGSVSALANTYVELAASLVRKQTHVQPGQDYASPPTGYGLLDFGAGGELPFGRQPIAIDFTIQNLLNASYRDYLSRFRYFTDDPGFNAVLRIRIPFGEADHEH